ncbi:MAG: AbrB/MazE/SpoVT family DNA-binding domain-containing protein [Candidatus Omnitrophica bacterium]|nr:AbrB/MazE/SpoVT family DNA-binding domain-containing protein [Candidatus Omnitrophota bacterium]
MKKVIEDVRKLTLTGKTTYYVTIPQEMIRSLGWRKGEKKVIRQEGKKIIIADWRP